MKLNKFLIWFSLFISIIVVDFNYLQKDVEASVVSSLLASRQAQNSKRYSRFKENFEIVPLSESLSDTTYSRFKDSNKRLEDNNSSTQYRIVTIKGGMEDTEENMNLLWKYHSELIEKTGSSRFSDSDNITLIIFKDIPFVYIAGNVDIENKINENNLSYKLTDENYEPDYTQEDIFDELANRFLDKADEVEKTGVLFNTINTEDLDDENDTSWSLIHFIGIGFFIVIITSLITSRMLKEEDITSRILKEEDSELDKVYNKYSSSDSNEITTRDYSDQKYNSQDILNDDKVYADYYKKMNTYGRLDNLIDIVEDGNISHLLLNISTDPDDDDFKSYLNDFIKETKLDVIKENIDLYEVITDFQYYFNDPTIVDEFILRLYNEECGTEKTPTINSSDENVSDGFGSINDLTNIDVEYTPETSIKSINNTNNNQLLDILKNRSLLPEGFKEYMFEKYKDQDFSSTGYFDLINIIDSELADFNK